MDLKQFIENIVNIAKTKITYLAETKLDNIDKKTRLDEAIVNYIQLYMDKVSVNFFVKAILKRVLIPLVPTLTQIIFDLIKTKVQGITQ